jgi:SNF2 family DNA or RNA helicase
LPLDLSPRTGAFPHQLEAERFIQGMTAVALFDEQGLGKTKIVLDVLLHEIQAGSIDGALIVCKHGLLPTWQSEIEKHTHVRGVVLSGSPGQTGLALMVYSAFYLTSYSLLHRELPRVRDLLRLRKMALVLDESHAIKNPKARTTKDLLSLSTLAHKRVILTGTPIANYPEDLWSQFYFLDGGKTLGSDFEAFRLYYNLGSGKGRRSVTAPDLTALAKQIRPLALRRTKQGTLELPEKSYESRTISLDGRQAEMYEQIRDELRLELLKDGRLIESIDLENVLERLLRLVQVCSNPALIDPEYSETPVKFRILDSLIKDLTNNDEKAVVWSQFVANVRLLSHRYRELGSACIHGGVELSNRQRIVDQFQTRPEKRLIFAVPAAAREGLTLTAANHAIYLDRNFNLVDYLQSQDRIHRIGQERTCMITKIVAQGTVDDFVESVLQRKLEIAETVHAGVKPKHLGEVIERSDVERVLGG